MRGATQCRFRPWWRSFCFNPRARAGRDCCLSKCLVHCIGFQPTRPCGARHRRPARVPSGGCFNPRARAGRDCSRVLPPVTVICFNPRARAGRDQCPATYPHTLPGFNPRARAGRDPDVAVVCVLHQMFQPTRPCGARRCEHNYADFKQIVSTHAPVRGATFAQQVTVRGYGRFNPRARAGRDQNSAY